MLDYVNRLVLEREYVPDSLKLLLYQNIFGRVTLNNTLIFSAATDENFGKIKLEFFRPEIAIMFDFFLGVERSTRTELFVNKEQFIACLNHLGQISRDPLFEILFGDGSDGSTFSRQLERHNIPHLALGSL